MKITGNHKMGRRTVNVEIANNRDIANALSGHMDSSRIRRKTIRGAVDSGAMRLVLPHAVVKELGLPVKKNKIRVRYADGRAGLRSEVGEVFLSIQGRDDVFSAVVEKNRETALIGAIVLEDLDFLVDCAKLRLVPRDPDHIVSEIEVVDEFDKNHR